MPKVDEAVTGCAGSMRGGAIVVSMLGAKTPTTSFPKGAFFNPMAWGVLIAPQAIWELDLSSLALLAEYCTALQVIFSFFHVRWSLSSEDVWDPIIMGGNEESGGGRRTCGKEMLLESGANGARGKALLDCE